MEYFLKIDGRRDSCLWLKKNDMEWNLQLLTF